MSEPWLVLVNPNAGRRPLEVDRVRAALTSAGVAFEVDTPLTPAAMGQAIREAAARGRWQLAVVGGDGTVSLAANEILIAVWSRRPVLGVLPTGTGCDLLRTFGMPNDLGEAARHLLGESLYPIDVGRLEGAWGIRYFVNVAQAGVGAAAAETAALMSRSWGKARYPLAFIRRLPRFPPAQLTVQISANGEGLRTHRGEGLAAIFANGQFFAGGWNVAPRSSLNDGRLDLQIINCQKTYAVRLVPKIIKGVHLTDRAVRRYATGAFELVTSPVWPIEADGDLVGNTPVSVSVVPGALDLKI
jgi:diacylglycerol kinase (ATP)